MSGRIFLFGTIATALMLGSSAPALQQPTPDPSRPVSVFVLDLAGDGYQLTSVEGGVMFDIDGTGKPIQVGWTASGADDGFLFLDTNGNGRVDSGRELLGNGWRLPDGSRSLSGDGALISIQGYPVPPPNPLPRGIGNVDPADQVFKNIRFWCDLNHNGQSEPDELKTLSELNIARVPAGFGRLGRKPDERGNIMLNEGGFFVMKQGVEVFHGMLEVVFARRGQASLPSLL